MGHQNRGNRDPLMVLALHPRKTLRGSLFPLLPLRVKCQNHERVPISPISPILVVYVFSSCQDMEISNMIMKNFKKKQGKMSKHMIIERKLKEKMNEKENE